MIRACPKPESRATARRRKRRIEREVIRAARVLTLLILSWVGPPVAPSLPRVSTTMGRWAELERETYARVQRMGEARR